MVKKRNYTNGKLSVPLEQPAEERIENHKPRLKVLTGDDIEITASQCGGCHSSTCQEGAGSLKLLLEENYPRRRCPSGDNIQQWLNLAADGDYEGAYEENVVTNSVGDITGAACPAHRLCGYGCMLTQTKREIAKHIAPTQAAIYENAWDKGLVKPLQKLSDAFNDPNLTTVKGADRVQVSSIGTGIAVHRPQEKFIENGADFTSYDGKPEAGGLVQWGIPWTKLKRGSYARHADRLRNGGAKYVLNTKVGIPQGGTASTTRYVSFEHVAEKSDIVYIATGLQERRWIPEKTLSADKQKHFIQGVDFIETQNRKLDGHHAPKFDTGEHNVFNKDVVIVGGGDTAWDNVALGIRSGARKITMLVRGTFKIAPHPFSDYKALELTQEDINNLLNGDYIGNYDLLDKELRSGIEEAIALAKKRGRRVQDVFDIKLKTQIKDVKNKAGKVEALVLETPGGEERMSADVVSLALGSDGFDLKTQFEFTNDSFQLLKGNRLPIKQYFNDIERRKILGHGHGNGGGVVGIYQTNSGRKVVVMGVGDVTRDNKGLDYSDEDALIVTAYRDGVNSLPDAYEAIENREKFINWAEQNNMALNYTP